MLLGADNWPVEIAPNPDKAQLDRLDVRSADRSRRHGRAGRTL
jgi:hypothetical protein